MRTAASLRIPLLVACASVLLLVGGQAALAQDEPTVPEPVAQYFATGLVPRLADLYGPGKNAGSGIAFGTTTKVGAIHRVFAWTTDFLAGKKTDHPTELTNNWVAPVAVKDRQVGLATIWINPSSDNPELATFDLGPGLVTALATAPKGDVLIRDDSHSAWFATDGTALVPLVSGSSGVATTTTIADYQGRLPRVTPAAPDSSSPANQGLVIAGIVLVIVIALLAVFVFLPIRRRAQLTVDDGGAPIASGLAAVAEAPVIRTRAARAATPSATQKPPLQDRPAAAVPKSSTPSAPKPAAKSTSKPPVAPKQPVAPKPPAVSKPPAKPAPAKKVTPPSSTSRKPPPPKP